MNAIRRTRPGHWANQPRREAVFICPSAIDTYEPPAFPFWPFAACVGFPFIVALVIWLVLTSLKG